MEFGGVSMTTAIVALIIFWLVIGLCLFLLVL